MIGISPNSRKTMICNDWRFLPEQYHDLKENRRDTALFRCKCVTLDPIRGEEENIYSALVTPLVVSISGVRLPSGNQSARLPPHRKDNETNRLP